MTGYANLRTGLFITQIAEGINVKLWPVRGGGREKMRQEAFLIML
jgi:hypothetical protein